jgi:predicted esterase
VRSLLASSLSVLAFVAHGELAGGVHEAKAATRTAWCAPETETLPGDVCYFDGNTGERKTLVIFLHGLIAPNTTWQWTQERAIVREARLFHFAAIMPKGLPVGRGGSGGFAWPGTNAKASEASVEQELIDGWAAAQRLLETRAGRTFDEVFVAGFSSGAYFATSLAVRDRVKADGYILLAGGAPTAAFADVGHRAPIFIGVGARDRATAPAARMLGQALTARAWPHRVDEQPVGHMVSDLHMVRAIAYLRASVDKARATAAAP